MLYATSLGIKITICCIRIKKQTDLFVYEINYIYLQRNKDYEPKR